MNAFQHGTDLAPSVELLNPASFSIGGDWPSAGDGEKFVAFFLENSVYCVSSGAVLEVIHPLPVVPLPHAPYSIAGIAAFRGEVVAVLNLKKILCLEDEVVSRKSKFVILRNEPGETQFAFAVDSMHELIFVPAEAATQDTNAPTGLTRLLEHENKVFKIIDPCMLLQKLEQSIG